MGGIISKISQWVLDIISATGHKGIFILSALESMAIPIPSEIVVPFSGFLSSQGRFGFWTVVINATLANLTGGLILYWISASGGRWLIEKYGKYILVSKTEIERADRAFEKHGSKMIFIGRMLPIVRTFLSIPAGVARMNVFKFIIYTIAGSTVWNYILALIGYKGGENWTQIQPYFHKFNYLIAVIVLVLVVRYVIRHIKHRQN